MDTDTQVAEVEARVASARQAQQQEQFKALRTQQYMEFDFLGDWLTGDQELQLQVAREDAMNHLIEGNQLVLPNAAWLIGLIDYCTTLKEVKEAMEPSSTDELVAELVNSTIQALSTLSMKDTKKEMLDRISKVIAVLNGALTE